MQRDMDLIRELLLEIESGKRRFSTLTRDLAEAIGVDASSSLSREEAEKLEHHLTLLENAGFVEFTRLTGGLWLVDLITWKGHEFLDSVRDPEIWRQTKAGAKKIGSWSAQALASIALAIAKDRLQKLVGGSLDG